MEKSEIVAGFLFPANEETTRAMEPRMRSLPYPAPCPIARNGGFLLFSLTTRANMIEIAARFYQQAHEWVVIDCIQTQVSWMLFTQRRPCDYDAIEC